MPGTSPRDRRGGLLRPGVTQQSHLSLFPIESLVDLIGSLGLIPIDIVGVMGLLIETVRGVSVQDRPSERRAFDRVTITAGRTVTPGEDELELPGARLSEKRDRIILQASGILLDVILDLVVEVWVVEAAEDVLNHRLLVGRIKVTDAMRRDVPVVVDFGAQRVIEGKRHLASLFRGQAVVELRDDGFR